MSPLLRDELHISLSPGKAGLVHLARGLRPVVVARRETACAAPEHDEMPWAKVLQGLDAGLRAMEVGKSDARVVLSNHFVRYALVPWSEQISNVQEEQAFVRLCFTKTYGDEARHWDLRMSPNGYGEMQVASAIDRGLVEGLERVLKANGARLVSLQPYLMTLFNQWRAELPESSLWFAVAEPGRLAVAQLHNGNWRSLRTMKVGDDWRPALQKLLEREFLISESGPERGALYLCAPGTAATDLPGWEVHQLDAPPPTALQSGIHPAMSMSE